MDQQYLTVAKIPMLDTGKFEQWQFRMQQYLQHEHYALWEVIEFGDSYKALENNPSTTTTSTTTTSTTRGDKSGRTVTLTTEDMQKKKNDVKSRTTLLLSLPDEHQLRFRWKVKDFKGMTFEEIEAKFAAVWKLVEDFIPMGLKEEAERLKRKRFNLEQEKAKKQKTSKEVPDKEKSPEEIPEEKVKEMMQLIPIEEVYVQALQVKHPIIDWKVQIEGQRSYCQIFRLGGTSACYQFFVDLLKHLDREYLNQLWVLVKGYLSIRLASSDKEMELWVELKRLYEPDPEDQLWAQTQNYMHAATEWKLYDLSGVHHVTAKNK
nr:hypothetical protein [Tanacetum cinerariifolium]